MPKVGAEYPRYATIKSDPDAAILKYDKVESMGELARANIAIQFAEGEYYADDALSERERRFISGKISFEVNELPYKLYAEMYGAEYDETEKTISSGADDSAPFGGYGFLRQRKLKGKLFYEAIFIPKVRAELGNDDSQTATNNVAFTGDTGDFTIFEQKNDKKTWRRISRFEGDTALTEARTWLDGQFIQAEP
ncbi:MAG: hypothetical protein FWF15_12390 [Oscillospiraceae bacterium]|nr:hypothetical protein [Oscillospiraceae bacterium]